MQQCEPGMDRRVKSWVMCSLSDQAPEVQPHKMAKFLARIPFPTLLPGPLDFPDSHPASALCSLWKPLQPLPPCPQPLSGCPSSVLCPVISPFWTTARATRKGSESYSPLYLQLLAGKDSTFRTGWCIGEWIIEKNYNLYFPPLGQLIVTAYITQQHTYHM